MGLHRTPLFELCQKEGARMVSFAGWEMPVQFSGLIKEHQAVRNEVGLFDISHMGVVLLEGKNIKDHLQALVPSDLNRIGTGEACYTLLLDQFGGILEDLIIYDLGPNQKQTNSLLLVLNSANYKKITNWLKKHLDKEEIVLSDAKHGNVLLALQGPKSRTILEALTDSSILSIPRFGHKKVSIKSISNEDIFISRTGYTGEEGFELLMPASAGQLFWQELIRQKVTPCGLGARDTLRLEAGMHLYGNDMNTDTTPFEAGLGWLVNLEMPADFIGREALEKQAQQGINRKLVGLKLENRAIARNGYPVLYKNQVVGQVTSGSWSPSLNAAIAMAYIPKDLAQPNNSFEIEIRGKQFGAIIVKKPFYRKAS